MSTTFDRDVVVVGGCGHVGLPLAIALADRGASVLIYDVNKTAVDQVNQATLPFAEPGAQGKLDRVVRNGALLASADPTVVEQAETVVLVIGTPVDEHLSPDPAVLPRAVAELSPHLRPGQLIVLRSTVYPGVTGMVERDLHELGHDLDVAFCPERIAEGKAMTELYSLPQIVSGTSERARKRAGELFRRLTDRIVELEPEEAELAKLFTNTWRYIRFAAVNQFYMLAESRGLDFERIRTGLMDHYPRAADMPAAGYAAGPCLFKDTMQLSAFGDNNFTLGHAAMFVNEGLPMFVVSRLAEEHDLSTMTVGILGAAFKGGSDDIRASLAYKLKRILSFRARRVLMTDPYVTVDPNLVPLEQVLAESDVLVVATPHPEYRSVDTDLPVADVWNVLGRDVHS